MHNVDRTNRMSWATRFRFHQAVKSSLWVVPLTGAFLGLVIGVVSVAVEKATGFPHALDYSTGTALAVLTTIVAATVGLTGFVVTVSVLVVQMATGTFSARYMRLWYRDSVLKAVLGVLLGTFTLSFSLLRHIGETVPNLGITLAGASLGVAIILFLFFLDRVIHRLRPVAVAALVARAGREALRASAALASTPDQAVTDAELAVLRSHAPALVLTSGVPGAIQAVDNEGLLAWARAHDTVLVFKRAAGDFVSSSTKLVEVYGEVAQPELTESRLRGMVALGMERTVEQDPAFAVRILVDIAERALSPAVNDPTTAVQMIDHLEDTLALIGTTPGLTGRWEYRDPDGALRMVMPAHRWEDFLQLGVTEIRQYGATSVQVVRRLRSALEELHETVLPEYVLAVEDELGRLDATVAEAYAGLPDADRARVSDRQGMGGPTDLGP